MEEKQSRNSRFVSLPGLAALLLAAVTANYFRSMLTGVFLTIVFLLCLSSYLWGKGICRRMEVEAAFLEESCHAGRKSQLRLRVKNCSLFPMVWLDVILPAGKQALVKLPGSALPGQFLFPGRPEAEAGIRQRFLWLLWQQEITWTQEIETLRRGVWNLEGASLQAGDGFGLSAAGGWKAFARPVRLVIYPKLIPVSAEPFFKIHQEAVTSSQGQMEDITILKNVRPYQPGDPAKRMNWRLLAASGRLVVNQYEQVMPGCTVFVLDLASFIRMVPVEAGQEGTGERPVFEEAELERMISLTASCMAAMAERGLQSGLVIPAYGDREARFCLPGEGLAGMEVREAFEALAELDYEGRIWETVRFPYEEFWRAVSRVGAVCICTRTDESRNLQDVAEQLGRGRARFLALRRKLGGCGEFDCVYGEEIALLGDPGGGAEYKESRENQEQKETQEEKEVGKG